MGPVKSRTAWLNQTPLQAFTAKDRKKKECFTLHNEVLEKSGADFQNVIFLFLHSFPRETTSQGSLTASLKRH